MPNRELCEYLSSCSDEGLGNFMLRQLDVASAARKSLEAELRALVDALVNAEIAYFLRSGDLSRIANVRQGILTFELPAPPEEPTRKLLKPANRIRKTA